jgi:ketosteroid isomerase-like protein
MRSKSNNPKELLARLAALNTCWLEGNPEKLSEFFHPDMVMALPGFRGKVQGLQSVVDSYTDFVRNGKVLDYQESDHQVDVWMDTAVLSYHFEIRYEIHGEEHTDTGHDLYVFTRNEEGEWLAVWRTLLEE